MLNVLSIGKSHWKKGYTYAIDAFLILKKQNIKFTYTIIGAANLELKYQIEELGLQNDVLVIEDIKFNKFQELLKTSDLILLSSVKEDVLEVVLPSMAVHKLVLATNFENIEDVIINGENGFVIPMRNVDAMANKMIEISEMSEDQKFTISAKALEIVQKQHSEELIVSGINDLYQSI